MTLIGSGRAGFCGGGGARFGIIELWRILLYPRILLVVVGGMARSVSAPSPPYTINMYMAVMVRNSVSVRSGEGVFLTDCQVPYERL